MLNRDIADGITLTKTSGASTCFAAAILFYLINNNLNIVLKEKGRKKLKQ